DCITFSLSHRERAGVRGVFSELPGEFCQEGAAVSDGFPGHVQAAALIGGYFCERWNRFLYFRERRIKRRFVSANMVLLAKTTGRDFHEIRSIDFSAGTAGACAKGHADRGDFYLDHILN